LGCKWSRKKMLVQKKNIYANGSYVIDNCKRG
jgi:hypothetical protein